MTVNDKTIEYIYEMYQNFISIFKNTTYFSKKKIILTLHVTFTKRKEIYNINNEMEKIFSKKINFNEILSILFSMKQLFFLLLF